MQKILRKYLHADPWGPAPGRPAAGKRGARRSAELSQEIEEADELMTANDVTTRFDGAVVLAEFDECN